jgi:hypothetical protein
MDLAIVLVFRPRLRRIVEKRQGEIRAHPSMARSRPTSIPYRLSLASERGTMHLSLMKQQAFANAVEVPLMNLGKTTPDRW